ncbi:putative c-_u-editing enzyme apobec-2 [Scleropages formosus]|uniref:mRNA(cytosine(6666)) deaminase n=1 Tax=Scleropages formosus TaxID=113540 RepID=A0A0P7WIY8_SCLFO|nr:C->U-editing enzyme APOBEC-2 [Scleropages formosus]KPP63632.1 putative c->u-editing enzyme apobec-2 [Scleropages formosus]
MADKKEGKTTSKVPLKKKVEKKVDKATEKEKAEKKVERKMEKVTEKGPEKGLDKVQEAAPEVAEGTAGTEVAGNGATASKATEEFVVEPMELPPFEIIIGERMSPFYFKFQFKNVEYSSGRNKTFLCFLVDVQGSGGEGLRGYLEDEHAGAHAEEAFFQQVLPQYDSALHYMVTWYVSSSPCAACTAKLVEILKARKTMRLTIFSARLFMWEEPEIQVGLKALAAAGCKLRMMKPTDFVYIWDTFVENEDQTFTPWEDCQENYEYYQEKLADILQ